MPSVPDLIWHDVPGYYGLNDQTTDFDDLQTFLDEYEGYVFKVDNLLDKYEKTD